MWLLCGDCEDKLLGEWGVIHLFICESGIFRIDNIAGKMVAMQMKKIFIFTCFNNNEKNQKNLSNKIQVFIHFFFSFMQTKVELKNLI